MPPLFARLKVWYCSRACELLAICRQRALTQSEADELAAEIAGLPEGRDLTAASAETVRGRR